jgi:hypothetical protein
VNKAATLRVASAIGAAVRASTTLCPLRVGDQLARYQGRRTFVIEVFSVCDPDSPSWFAEAFTVRAVGRGKRRGYNSSMIPITSANLRWWTKL